MLDAEAALARALASAGVIDGGGGGGDRGRVRRRSASTPAAIAAAAAGSGNPVVPLKAALTEAVEGPAAAHVHRGATSQDILDTAAMLVAARALDPLLDDLLAARERGGRARARPPRHADRRAHAAPAGGAGDVRAQGGGLDGRARGRAALAERAARRAARGAARRRGGHARLARRGRAGAWPRPTRRRSGCPSRCCRGTRCAGGSASSRRALAVTSGAVAKVARDVDPALPDRGRRGARGARAAGRRRCRTSATRWRRSARSRARSRRRAWRRRCSARWRTSTSARPARGTRSGGRSASCCARPARRSRGCASRSRGSRPTRSGCGRTSTRPAGGCWPSA